MSQKIPLATRTNTAYNSNNVSNNTSCLPSPNRPAAPACFPSHEIQHQQYHVDNQIVDENVPTAVHAVDAVEPQPWAVPQYVDEIIAHLLRRETTVPRDPRYLTRQSDVTERMRNILNDWLIDVAIKFRVHPETFYLAIDIVDRYLMCKSVTRSQLQLVGVTAILIAAKHDEIWAPEIKECIYISANTYTAEEVISMELSIAAELNFRFTVPTPYQFFCNLLDRLNADRVTRNCALFYLDCSVLDFSMLEYLPSQVAGAACFLALLTIFGSLPVDQWVNHYEIASFVPTTAVLDCATALLATAKSLASPNSRFQAVRRKFSSSRYDGVALFALPESVPTIVFE